jgi:adenylate kinase
MKNIVLFGPPGSGKGTQANHIISKYKLIHLSTGDMLRAEIAAQTSLGIKAKLLMDKGELVPDAVVIGMIENKLNANKTVAGFVFDGFPRTVKQAEALDDLLAKRNAPIRKVLSLKVSEAELTKRILDRGKTSGRADDQNEKIVKNRVVEYRTKTEPLAKYYAKQNKLVEIQGEGTVDHIADLLNFEIDNIDETKVPEHKSIISEVSSFITHTVDGILHRKTEETQQPKKETPIVKPTSAHLPFPLIDKTIEKIESDVKKEVKKDVKKVVDGAKNIVKAITPSAATKKAPAKKVAATVKKTVKSIVSKKPVKKAVAIVKRAVKNVVPKKTVKKAAAIAKKIVPKKAAVVIKKVAKKAAPKKVNIVVKKAVNKVIPKKLVKKAPAKKIVAKKSVPKKVAAIAKKAAKKVAPKKVTKKVAAVVKKAVKKITPKKVIKKALPKKIIKKVVTAAKKVVAKKVVAKKVVAKKAVVKKAVKKIAAKKTPAKKAVAKKSAIKKQGRR